MKHRIKDMVIAMVITAIVVAVDLWDGVLQWRMDVAVLFLVLLLVFWMRSLARTRKMRRDLYMRMRTQQKEEEQ